MHSKMAVEEKYNAYPKAPAAALTKLRDLIKLVANEIGINDVTQDLKWGEPSFICKHGSTIRIDWKEKTPDQYAIYFNCKTLLIETFKELYPEEFTYSGNRAIIFNIEQEIPTAALKHCLALALTYHKVRHLPLLGA